MRNSTQNDDSSPQAPISPISAPSARQTQSSAYPRPGQHRILAPVELAELALLTLKAWRVLLDIADYKIASAPDSRAVVSLREEYEQLRRLHD